MIKNKSYFVDFANGTCSTHSSTMSTVWIIWSWPNGNSFSDWNVVGFVVWIYRESANKSNSWLTPTFRGRQREIAPDSRRCMHISLLQRFALLFLRTPFHLGSCLAREFSLRVVEIIRAVDRRRRSMVRLTKEADVKSGPQPCPKTFALVRRKRRLLVRNLRESYAADGAERNNVEAERRRGG